MTVAILLAAGLGERLGLQEPKALAELAGRPLWRWSFDVLRAAPGIEQIVLATPAAQLDAMRAQALATVERPADPSCAGTPSGGESDRARTVVSRPLPAAPAVTVVAGGAVRSESVRRALAVAEAASEDSLVLVHDAARPLVTTELIHEALAGARREGVDAAVAAAPVTDTIKQADGDGRVLSTLDRSALWAAQTPQVFRRGALRRALAVSDDVLAQATDDAWLIERMGGRVVVVPAPRENLKVTTPVDLELAALLLARRGGTAAA